MQVQGPLFESWRVLCGRRVLSLHCVSLAGSFGALGWGMWCSDHSRYGSIQYFLADGAPTKSRPGGSVTNGRPRAPSCSSKIRYSPFFLIIYYFILTLTLCLESGKEREKNEKARKVNHFYCLVVQEKRKVDEVKWYFFHRPHYFGISPICVEMAWRDGTNFLEPTTLYCK